MVTDEQVLELARQADVAVYAIALAARPRAGPPAHRLCPGHALPDRAHARQRRPVYFTDSAAELDGDLRPDRRGAADAVHARLRVAATDAATASGAGSWCGRPHAMTSRSATRSATTRRGDEESAPSARAHVRRGPARRVGWRLQRRIGRRLQNDAGREHHLPTAAGRPGTGGGHPARGELVPRRGRTQLTAISQRRARDLPPRQALVHGGADEALLWQSRRRSSTMSFHTGSAIGRGAIAPASS